jgi:ribosomal-protein-alanine N-acetyltransferase
MALAPERHGLTEVEIEPMRRRHIRSVLAIETRVYPRPWTAPLFQSELALSETRCYVIAKIGRELVGYGGVMMSLRDGHITTIAVDPSQRRKGIATRLLLALVRAALARDAEALTLEVRLSNRAAQELYRRFGFAPVGVRKGYYQDHDEIEDALIMWAHDIRAPEYEALLQQLERRDRSGANS